MTVEFLQLRNKYLKTETQISIPERLDSQKPYCSLRFQTKSDGTRRTVELHLCAFSQNNDWGIDICDLVWYTIKVADVAQVVAQRLGKA